MSEQMMYAMSLLDAANKAVRNYKHGGPEAIAARLGKSWETLRKELAGAEGYKLGALDLFLILEWTQDQDLRNAIAAQLGGMLMTLPSLQEAIDCPYEALGQLADKGGSYTKEIAKSFKDGHVSLNETKRCEAALAELIATAQAAQTLVRASYVAGIPEHERRQTVRRAADRKRDGKGA